MGKQWSPPETDTPVETTGWHPPATDIEVAPQKKSTIGNVLPSGVPKSSIGFPSFQDTESTPFSGVTKDPALQQQLLQQGQQRAQQKNDAALKPLKAYMDKLSPQEKQDLQAGFEASRQQHANDNISATPKEQQDDYTRSQTTIGKLINGTKYLAQKATKGGLQVVKGAAYLANIGANLQNPNTAINALDDNPGIDKAFDKADKATDFLSKGNQARVEDSKTMANLGGLAEFLPAAAGAEASGGATFYLQGLGQGKEIIDNAEKNGAKVNPLVKNAFILGSGLVNGALMHDIGIFKTLPSSLKNDVVASITTNAIKDAAGKDLTGAEFKNLLQQGAKTWQDKALQGGYNYLKNTKHAIENLTALNVGNFALKQGVNAASDKPVFNENLGNLAEQEGGTLGLSAALGVIGGLKESKISPYSQYKNTVVESLMKDPSEENTAQLKQHFEEHAQNEGYTPEETHSSLNAIDDIAKVAKSLPRGVHHSQVEKAVDIVQGRNELQGQLDEMKQGRDEGLAEVNSPGEQMLTDKIDQANDKLTNIVRGSKNKITYQHDEEKGKFYKVDPSGKKTEIPESRYDLEQIEKKPNEQTVPNAELPVKTPADEPVKTQEPVKAVDETGGGNKVAQETSVDHFKLGDQDEFYHASPTKRVGRLKEGTAPQFGKGVYFSTNKDLVMDEFGKELTKVNLKIKKPLFTGTLEEGKVQDLAAKNWNRDNLTWDKQDEVWRDKKGKEVDPVTAADLGEHLPVTYLSDAAKELGYDAIIDKNSHTYDNEIVVLDESKIHYKDDENNLTTNPNKNEKINEADGTETQGSKETVPAEKEVVKSGEAKAEPVTKGTKGDLTSIKNDKIDADREKRGLSPLMSAAKKDFPTTWENAMKTLDENPDAARDLVDALDKKPRPTSDEENALISHHLVETKNKYDELNDQIVKAQDEGKDTAELNDKLDIVSDRLKTIEDVSRKVGTESGRSLNSRRLMLKDDFTLSSLETQMRASKGRPLTDEERDGLREIIKQHEQKQKDLEETISRLEARNRKEKEDEALTGLKKQVKKEKKVAGAKERKEQREVLVQDIRNKLKALRKTNTLTSSIPFAQQVKELVAISPELAKLAKSYIAEGIDKLDDLVDKIHDDLKDAFEGLEKRAVRDAISGYGVDSEKQTKSKTQATLEELKKQAKLISRIEDLEAGIKKSGKPNAKATAEVEELQKKVAELTRDDTVLKATKTRLKNEIEALEKEIKTGEKPQEKEKVKPDAEINALKAKRDNLKSQLETVEKEGLTNEQRLQGLKTRVANQIAEYQRRLREKDFAPAEKRPPIDLDPEAIKAKAALNRIKTDFENEREKDRLANRSAAQRAIDKFLAYRRGILLSSVATLGKIGTAATYRIIGTPLHEIAGTILRQAPLLKRIAAKAPREGHAFNLNAEQKAVASLWDADTWAQVKKKVLGKLDDIDEVFGGKHDRITASPLLEIFGNLHGAEKELAKVNEFKRSVALRTKFYSDKGVDINNPLVQVQIGMEAYKDANRSIFMSDNLANNAYRMTMNYLESASVKSKFGAAGRNSAAVLKTLLPIVKVPTNYLVEKTQYIPAVGALKAFNIIRKGASEMSPEQADYVMRVMKKQSIGAGLLVLGYLHPQNLGGFNIGGQKRKEGDLKANDIELFGLKAPHWLTHTPMLSILQMGATIRRAVDQYGKLSGAGKASLATASDVAESTPFYETPKEISKAMENTTNATAFMGNFLRGLIVPPDVKTIAEHYDKDSEGNPIQRHPKSVLEGIEQGIPGLRQNVSIKVPRPNFDKIDIGEDKYQLNNDQIQEREKYYQEFLKSIAAKTIRDEIAKATNPKVKEDLQKRLKTVASKYSKGKILAKYYDSETGKVKLEKVDEE